MIVLMQCYFVDNRMDKTRGGRGRGRRANDARVPTPLPPPPDARIPAAPPPPPADQISCLHLLQI